MGVLRALAVLLIAGISASAFAETGARQTSPAGEEGSAREVTVSEDDGLYSVSARFLANAPAAAVFAVLTDYEQIPRFMPGVETSVVRERFDDGVLLEQEAVSKLFLFSRRVYLLLEVTEGRNTIRFRDAGGRSFSQYEGVWRLAADDGQTLIRYELNARPSFSVPEMFLKRVLARDARQMIERLLQEISVRQAPPL